MSATPRLSASDRFMVEKYDWWYCPTDGAHWPCMYNVWSKPYSHWRCPARSKRCPSPTKCVQLHRQLTARGET